MRHLLLIVFVIAVTEIGGVCAIPPAIDCAMQLSFNISVLQGRELSNRALRRLEIREDGARYFKLDRGGTGTVYRVIHADGSMIGQKEFEVGLNRDNDQAAFNVLRSLPSFSDVSLLMPVNRGDRSWQVPDIRGRSLGHALNWHELTSIEKTHLLERWNDYVSQTTNNLKPISYSVSLDSIAHALNATARVKDGEKQIDILLKPGNAVVETQTGELFLADPY